ncbi:DHH family phosphoesterase [Adhaeribacter radiodurans]|uniref:Bifunctional oligoribonuclease/PAP phosphatase NrnA n=1 Tax=Adhaeribacter radiodurans TaxID=2745197 RepID=A0A7L7L2N7_9BACT|nr:bifunctional oligoribonuclease/PAP phosphatase NrnA [Adhaeribacter radiodurans]QMU27054.1 bifunctional oligoribonuclease/PAP phosphatase NrnA [Adhaeribacter radiodurans]
MQQITALKELLQEPKEILITTHHKPDADALGSSLGLAGYLKKKGHVVTVVTPSDYPDFLNWMNGNNEVITYDPNVNDELVRKLINQANVIFCLDFSSLSRINELGPYVQEAPGVKVLVDHHLEPENFAEISFSNTKAAATAELVFELIRDLGDQSLIDVHIGECLYAGIMTDTGSFRHPSTSRNVHLIIAELLHVGVNTSNIHRLIYDSHTETRLRFLGYVLKDKLTVLREFRTAYIAITADELKHYDSKTGDTEGLVNFALSIEGVVFAALIIDRSNAVKMSFRSVGDFSVNDFARKHFQGGGHRNAAGGISYDSLTDTVAKFLQTLPEYKDQLTKDN